MKKTKSIKFLVLVISLALLISGIIGIAVSADSSDAEASLSIYKKNVSFQSSPQLVFAVAYENLNSEDITLDVWYGEKSGDAASVSSFGNVTVDGKEYPAFAVKPTDPKDIDSIVYVQAKCGDTVSEVERYSILEFAWSGIMTAASVADAADYQNILDYSATVQKWLTASGKFNGTPVGNYFYVKAEGIALDASGYDSGIFTSPVTFTLGESALGWNVTTYSNGTKTNEVKAAGTEITASASTICTPVEKIAPQQVAGTVVDFENIDSTGHAGEGTTFFAASEIKTSKRGTTEVVGKDGNTTKAYYFDSDSGVGDTLRVQANGDDTNAAKLAGANAFIFESDIKIDFTDTSTIVAIYLGDSSAVNTSQSAYYINMRLDTDGTIKIIDGGLGGNGNWIKTSVESGDWFNFRIEYYKISADEMLVLTFIDGELVYASNRIHSANPNGDDAWPVYAESYTANSGKTHTGLTGIFFNITSSGDATMYFDNSLLRRTTLTAPTIPVSEYDSYYTPAN